MSMWRRFVRRGAPVLVLILTLSLALPRPAEAGDWTLWDTAWSWLVDLWSADGDRGLEIDPDGTTDDEEDRGLGLDPDGITSDGDRGLGLDPNG
jgi:hypothetical protein